MTHVERVIALLVRSATRMSEVYAAICQIPQPGPTEVFLKDKIEKWTNNLGGALGHMAEFEIYYKHRIVKGRRVAPPGGTGDVVIGEPDDPFAKTIQSKAITTAAPSTVTKDLQDAMQQLAGLSGETPRPNDNYVVQITIYNSDNPWPFTRNILSAQGLPPLFEVQKCIVTEARNAIQLALGIQNTKNQNTLSQVFKSAARTVASAPGPRSTRLAAPGPPQQVTHFNPITETTTVHQIPSWFQKAVLLVKIKWPFGYGYDNKGSLALIKALTIRFTDDKNFQIVKCEDLT